MVLIKIFPFIFPITVNVEIVSDKISIDLRLLDPVRGVLLSVFFITIFFQNGAFFVMHIVCNGTQESYYNHISEEGHFCNLSKQKLREEEQEENRREQGEEKREKKRSCLWIRSVCAVANHRFSSAA